MLFATFLALSAAAGAENLPATVPGISSASVESDRQFLEQVEAASPTAAGEASRPASVPDQNRPIAQQNPPPVAESPAPAGITTPSESLQPPIVSRPAKPQGLTQATEPRPAKRVESLKRVITSTESEVSGPARKEATPRKKTAPTLALAGSSLRALNGEGPGIVGRAIAPDQELVSEAVPGAVTLYRTTTVKPDGRYVHLGTAD